MIFVANWKMNLCTSEELDLFCKIIELEEEAHNLVICPSFLSIRECARNLFEKNPESSIFLGAQDCSNHPSGNYTGQINAKSIKDAGCTHCIVGHYETRKAQKLYERDVVDKARTVLSAGLIPIICIGAENPEPPAVRHQAEVYHDILDAKELAQVIFVYEPAHAIGTGKRDTLESIAQATEEIKSVFAELEGKVKVLYGGSVTPDNIDQIWAVDSVDGFLVGNSSLNFQDVKKMLECP